MVRVPSSTGPRGAPPPASRPARDSAPDASAGQGTAEVGASDAASTAASDSGPASVTTPPDSTATAPPAAEGPLPVRPVAPPMDDRTAFKVVLTYTPTVDGRWHCLIALGREGCDPFFEPADIADWPEALDAVLGVRAAAEARWAERPRNPMPSAATNGRKAAVAGGAPGATKLPSGERGAERHGSKERRADSQATAGKVASDGAPARPAPAVETALADGVEKLTLF